MAKFRYKTPQHSTGTIITTKTHFGSHKEMVVEPIPEQSGIHLKANEVICRDDLGLYITEKTKLDNGLADPNRYSESKRLHVCEQ